MAAKATQAEKEARLTRVYQMLVGGASRPAVLQHAAKEWSLSTRSTDELIAEAKRRIIEDAKPQQELELSKAILRLNSIYASCVKVTDYQRAIAAQRELNLLLGLYAPPATQTLKLIGMDTRQFNDLIGAIEAANLSPSQVFQAMFDQLAAANSAKVDK